MIDAVLRQMPVAVRSGLLRLVPALLMTAGCASLLPTTAGTELEVQNPLRGTPEEIRTIALVPPSGLESYFSVTDASRGRLDKVGMAIGDRLEKKGRFKIASPVQYQEALARERAKIDVRLTGVPPEGARRAAVLAAARQVGADAVLYVDGRWESALVVKAVTFGRPEYRRRLTGALVSARTGETVWYQEATVVIREGLTTPQEDSLRETVACDVADNLMETVR